MATTDELYERLGEVSTELRTVGSDVQELSHRVDGINTTLVHVQEDVAKFAGEKSGARRTWTRIGAVLGTLLAGSGIGAVLAQWWMK